MNAPLCHGECGRKYEVMFTAIRMECPACGREIAVGPLVKASADIAADLTDSQYDDAFRQRLADAIDGD